MNIERNLRLRRDDVGKRLTSIGIVCLLVTAGLLGFITFKSDVASAAIIYVGSGPGNNTASIQDAIDNYANDGDTVYVHSGIYFENVWVNKTINLIGEDRDSTVIDGGGGGDVVSIWTADWVNVSGFTVTNGQSGIKLLAVQNCRVYNNLVFTHDHHGISLSYSIGNNITGNTVSNNHDGISLYGSGWNNITGNEVSNNDNGIRLIDSSWNNITDNIVHFNRDHGIILWSSNNNNLINNNASSNGVVGIWLDQSSENTLAGNTMINNGIWIEGPELEHWNTHDIDTSNTVNSKPVQYWNNRIGGKVPARAGQVILANCTNIRVEGQELTYGTVGIELGFSSNNYIEDNDLSSNSLNGIYLYSSKENIINYNNASYNSGEGIELGISNGNNIIGNNVSNNMRGIRLANSSGNDIIGNLVSNNLWGFYLNFDSENNNIIGNNISNNLIGIWLTQKTSSNLIYHNRILNNTNQAIDETNNSNQWDNGYPSGGNFWSNFDEPSEGAYDDYQGANQDDPISGDGIVDNGTIGGGGKNPYVIDSDSQDNYPLLKFVKYLFLYEGWNLISVPFIQPDTNLDIVLNSIKGSYDAVQWYNVSDKSDPWKHSSTKKPSHLNDLDDIHHKMGFWIHITQPGGILFQYSGIQPIENQTITLHPGWNLVGYPSLISFNRPQGLNNISFGVDVDSIWTYNAATKKWEGIGDSDYFEIGRGYWVHSKVEITWEVPL